jgi:hypothetical protein
MEEKIKKIVENLIEVQKLQKKLYDKDFWIRKAAKEAGFIPLEDDWISVIVTLHRIEIGVHHKHYGDSMYWTNGQWSSKVFDITYPMFDEMISVTK